MITTYFIITTHTHTHTHTHIFWTTPLIYVRNCRVTSFMLPNNRAENQITKLTSLIVRLTSVMLRNERSVVTTRLTWWC